MISTIRRNFRDRFGLFKWNSQRSIVTTDSLESGQTVPWRVLSVSESEAKFELTGTLRKLESVASHKMVDKEEKPNRSIVHKDSRQISLMFRTFYILTCALIIFNVYIIVAMGEEKSLVVKDKAILVSLSRLSKVINSTCHELQASIRFLLHQDDMESVLVARQKNDVAMTAMPEEFIEQRFLFGTLLVGRFRLQAAFYSIRKRIDTLSSHDPYFIQNSYLLLLNFLVLNLRANALNLTKLEHGTDLRLFEQSVINLVRLHQCWSQVTYLVRGHLENTTMPEEEIARASMGVVNVINDLAGLNKTRLFRALFSYMTYKEWRFLKAVRRVCVNTNDLQSLCNWFKRNKSKLGTDLTVVMKKLLILPEKTFSKLLKYEEKQERKAIIWLFVNSTLLVSVIFVFIAAIARHISEKNIIKSYLNIEEGLNCKEIGIRTKMLETLSEVVPEHLCNKLLEESLDRKEPKSGSRLNSALPKTFQTIKQHLMCFTLFPPNKTAPLLTSTRNTEALQRLAQETCKCMRNPAVPISWIRTEETTQFDLKQKPEVHDRATLLQIDLPCLSRLIEVFSMNEFLKLVETLTKIIDERVHLYDVFALSQKLDSFTVISGISQQQSNSHVTEVANLALDIMCTCSDLELTSGGCDTKIRPRIAIHSDSCFSLLSPFPAPRFRVFGEILYTVKHLLGTCQCNRILMSEQTAMLLRKKGAYNTQLKGYTELPSGRVIGSYWLMGRRVSECRFNRDADIKIRRQLAMPMKLEQKPLYRLDNLQGSHWLSPLPSPGIFSEEDCDDFPFYLNDVDERDQH